MDNSQTEITPKLTPQRVKSALLTGEKTFVYQFGRGVGFCADYIWMLTCLVKCLQFNYEFRLSATSHPKGFATNSGWNDYFEPFFLETRGPLLSRLNRTQFLFSRRLPFIKDLVRPWVKVTTAPKADLFMFDDLGTLTHLGPPIFNPYQSFNSACKELIDILWVLNERTRAEVAACVAQMGCPQNFMAIHVRRGDKVSEHPYVSISKYIAAVRNLADGSDNIFVATDDHRIIPEFERQLSQRVFSSGASALAGYDQQTFNRAPPSDRRNQTIRFLAELEMMKRATHFIGSQSSNVAALVSLQRGEERVTWV